MLYDANKNTSCLFSGDTVFLGEVGRPDLAVNNHLTTTDLAEMLFHSIEKLKKLDPHIRLYPGHGSGSACGKKIGTGNYCILENQFKENYGFIKKDKEEFVKAAIEGIPQPPSYFFYDAKLNQVGP